MKRIANKGNSSRRGFLLFAVIFALAGGYFLWRVLASNPNLPGDENNDGSVDVLDLSIVLSNWHTNNPNVDLNGDGYVDVLDISVLLSHWGKSGQAGICSGITKNSSGTYTFAQLTVKNGRPVDNNGCTVHLVGLNEGDFFTGSSGAPGAYDLARYTFLKSDINQNIDRINFQARWWDEDVLVPDANMNFRAWLEQYVKMAETAGNYVELDVGPQYFEPPCGKSISHCPSQDQGSKDYAADPACANNSRSCPEAAEISGGDESVPLQALTDLGKLYANDPAVIMDVWNEPLDANPLALTPSEYFSMMNIRINTLRASAPNMPVVVYSYHIMQEMAAGNVPPYSQPNLIIDMHSYNPNLQPSDLLPSIQYFQSQGWAEMLGEYGGSTASETALQSIVSLSNTNDMGALYFSAGNLFDALNKTPPPYTLNANGLLVQKYYQQMLPVTSQ